MAAQSRTSTGQVTANVTDNEQIKQTWNAWRTDKKRFSNVFVQVMQRQNGKLLAVGLLHVAGAREASMHETTQYTRNSIIRIKSGEPCFPGFSVPGRLGGVICKPEGAA